VVTSTQHAAEAEERYRADRRAEAGEQQTGA